MSSHCARCSPGSRWRSARSAPLRHSISSRRASCRCGTARSRPNTPEGLVGQARMRGVTSGSCTNPAQRLKAAVPGPSLLPMTEDEIRAVEQAITLPGQRLIVALAAVHAARWEAIRALTLDDLNLPNRRITIAGHPQRLGDLSHRALRAWLGHRRATCPHTPNRHVLVSEKTALGDGPVTR